MAGGAVSTLRQGGAKGRFEIAPAVIRSGASAGDAPAPSINFGVQFSKALRRKGGAFQVAA